MFVYLFVAGRDVDLMTVSAPCQEPLSLSHSPCQMSTSTPGGVLLTMTGNDGEYQSQDKQSPARAWCERSRSDGVVQNIPIKLVQTSLRDERLFLW